MTHTSVTPAANVTPLTMADLYKRVVAMGLPKKYLKTHIMPDWWTDEVDQDPNVLLEGALYLSRRLNLDIASLLEEDAPHFKASSNPKFKTKKGTDLTQLDISKAIASRIAEIVAYACPKPYRDITAFSIADIRNQMLSSYPTISLLGVLEFCWSLGIPVIHFAQIPAKAKRFHGMVAYFHGRPVIIVGRKDRFPAWLIFVIAHELGHIFSGHLATDGFILDEEIQLESDDIEEQAANQFAADLLLGSTASYDDHSKYLKGEALAAKAKQLSQGSQNEPSVIALNIAWKRAKRSQTEEECCIAWATGLAALKILEKDLNAPQQINQFLRQSIQWDDLKEDSQDYLTTMLSLPELSLPESALTD